MPGSISDAYDPEFGTAENAAIVEQAITHLRDRIAEEIGDGKLKDIVTLAKQYIVDDGRTNKAEVRLSIVELRILRFAMNRALESI